MSVCACVRACVCVCVYVCVCVVVVVVVVVFCECSESARERRIALHKSYQQQSSNVRLSLFNRWVGHLNGITAGSLFSSKLVRRRYTCHG